MHKIIIQTTDKNTSDVFLTLFKKELFESSVFVSESHQQTLQMMSEKTCIFFVDVNQCNKKDLLSLILKFPKLKIIIFGEENQFSFSLYDITHSYYLHFPLTNEKIYKAYQKAQFELNLGYKARIILKYKNEEEIIEQDQILYLYSEGRYVNIMTNHGEYKVISKLDDLEAKLNHEFYRTHKSFIVNMKYVIKISREDCKLSNQKHVPIARNKFNDFKNKLLDFISI